MNRPRRHPLVAGAQITGLGTLSSRVLGMVRDMATAALLGMAGGGVMDAFVVAYRVPNLFRRLFGEGALTASYLPVFAAELEKDRRSAWQLASVTLTWLSVLLAGAVLLGEAIYGLVWLAWRDAPGVGLLVGLGAVMLPYLLLICVAAQLSATLHALSHFSIPALTPTVANLCWLAAAWLVAPWFAPDPRAQVYVLAVSVLVAGVLQVAVQVPVLRRFGFRYDYRLSAVRDPLRRVAWAMVPMLAGLAVTQINTLLDSLIAWGLAAAPDGPKQIAWLGGAVDYPLRQGAAAALYYGERLYQFPVGILGVAVASAIFPLLSRHAARGDKERLGSDLTLGLRLVFFLGLPAGVGLILLAEPLTRLLLQRGRFTADDTVRTAWTVVCYSLGVWAYCALPVIVRGYYALGHYTAPAKIAAWIVALDLTGNLILVWTPLEESALALTTSISAAVHVAILGSLFSRAHSPLGWAVLAGSALRTLLASLAMAAAGYGALALVAGRTGLSGQLVQVLLPLAVSLAVYFAAHRLLRGDELAILLGLKTGDAEGAHRR